MYLYIIHTYIMCMHMVCVYIYVRVCVIPPHSYTQIQRFIIRNWLTQLWRLAKHLQNQAGKQEGRAPAS